MVATTIYETENCGGDNITPGEDVSRTNSDFGEGGRCEANTNVPGAPRILDPPLLIIYSLIIHEKNTKNISTMSETLYVIKLYSKFLLDFYG